MANTFEVARWARFFVVFFVFLDAMLFSGLYNRQNRNNHHTQTLSQKQFPVKILNSTSQNYSNETRTTRTQARTLKLFTFPDIGAQTSDETIKSFPASHTGSLKNARVEGINQPIHGHPCISGASIKKLISPKLLFGVFHFTVSSRF